MDLSFENLEVWRDAMDLAVDIYRVTESFPKEEQFGVKSQLRRATTSIALNIAEGKGRYHDKEFVQFLYFARGSLYETITLLKLAMRLSYITQNQSHHALQSCFNIMSKLSGLINSLKGLRP